MAAVVAHVATTVVLAGLVILVLRSAPSPRGYREIALEEVLRRGGEYRERQKVGATDSEWSVNVKAPTAGEGGYDDGEGRKPLLTDDGAVKRKKGRIRRPVRLRSTSSHRASENGRHTTDE
jgi:hypothetical protein